EEMGRMVKFDVTELTRRCEHNGLELGKVFPDLPIKIATRDDLLSFFKRKFNTDDNRYNYSFHEGRTGFQEDSAFGFEPDLINLDNVYLAGYWQNVRYFEKYRQQLLDRFQFRDIEEYDTINILTKRMIMDSQAVSIHIRRGDYLYNSFYLSLPKVYYTEAISLVMQYVDTPDFFVFSDDIPYAKSLISEKHTHFITTNRGSDSYKDMLLMSLCKVNIIANSTFSWWASWLNKNSDHLMISPSQWFTQDRNLVGFDPQSNFIKVNI